VREKLCPDINYHTYNSIKDRRLISDLCASQSHATCRLASTDEGGGHTSSSGSSMQTIELLSANIRFSMLFCLKERLIPRFSAGECKAGGATETGGIL
jgi:hypothetical protein